MAIEASLVWRSEQASHCDRLLLADSACLADGRWLRAAEQARLGGEAELAAAPWLQPAGLAVAELAVSQFRLPTQPVPGRFYPHMAFASLERNPRDMRPARVLDAADGRMRVDPNHPLAGRDATLILRELAQEPTRGVRMVELFEGPGMQAPSPNAGVTYFQPAGLRRQDAAADAQFYARARLTHHLDAACRAEISALHGRLIKPALPVVRVLDLMSSWVTHLPADMPAVVQVAGLGMNREELAANPLLSERVVQDLNVHAELPWPDAAFDAVICTASIEYLIDPAAVAAQVRRVLKPGGAFIVTFSDRWFPSKAIQVWSDLHPYERLGLVLALLRDAGFNDLHSETRRGLQRPQDDPYIEQRLYADPLFAAWGAA